MSGNVRKLAMAVLLAALAAGCDSDDNAGQLISTPPEGILPIINAETGVAVYGSWRYALAPHEQRNLESAGNRAMSECLERNGVSDYLNWREYPEEYVAEHTFVGVWRVADAERFAFSTPMPLENQILNGINNSIVSDRDVESAQHVLDDLAHRLEQRRVAREGRAFTEAAEDCTDDPLVKEWGDRAQSATVGPWFEEFRAADEYAFRDPRVAALKAEYDSCVESAGLVPAATGASADNIFAVAGQRFELVDEGQIEMAVQVVRCKESVRAVDRLLNIVAEYEAPIYLKYESELAAARAELDAIRSEVDAFWSTRK